MCVSHVRAVCHPCASAHPLSQRTVAHTVEVQDCKLARRASIRSRWGWLLLLGLPLLYARPLCRWDHLCDIGVYFFRSYPRHFAI